MTETSLLALVDELENALGSAMGGQHNSQEWYEKHTPGEPTHMQEIDAAFAALRAGISAFRPTAQSAVSDDALLAAIREALTARFDDGRDEYLLRHGVIRAGFTQTVNATKNYENRLVKAIQATRQPVQPGGEREEYATLLETMADEVHNTGETVIDGEKLRKAAALLRAQQAKPVVDDAMVDRAIDGYYRPPAFNWRARPDLAVKMRERFRRSLTAALSTGEE